MRLFYFHRTERDLTMIKEKKQKDKKGQGAICPIIDKYLIATKLKAMVEESGSIAEYIGDTVQYGRALGYAEGRHAACLGIMNEVLEGEFDPYMEGEGGDVYEM